MQTRQSTMFKPFKVFAIFLALIVLVHSQQTSSEESTEFTEVADSRESTNAVEIPDLDENDNSVLDGDLLIGILDLLQSGPLGIIFVPLGLILRPIFTGVDLILSPVFFLVRTILRPVLFLLNGLLLPAHGIAGLLSSVTSLVEGILSMVTTFLSLLLSNVSGILSFVLAQVSLETGVERRRRRGIMDPMMGMARILSFPFRFVYDIISTIISTIYSPFHLIFRVPSGLFHLIFGGGKGGDLSSEIALSTDLSPINDLISSLLLNVSESSQDALLELAGQAWILFKEYVLPRLDEFSVTATTSSLVPDDIKEWLRSLHTGYTLLHTFGIL